MTEFVVPHPRAMRVQRDGPEIQIAVMYGGDGTGDGGYGVVLDSVPCGKDRRVVEATLAEARRRAGALGVPVEDRT